VQLPDSGWYGPVLGSLDLTIQGGATLTRLRTQNVPAQAPSGLYVYIARAGDYPDIIWASDSLQFTKLGSGTQDSGFGDWTNTGEEITASDEPFITHHSSLITSIRPNPFNPTTAISFKLSADSHVQLQVFDIAGRLAATLMDGWREAGVHEVTFDPKGASGSDLAAGIYVYRLTAGEFIASGKMVLLK